MAWVAVAVGVGSVATGALGANAAGKAANASVKGDQAAIAEQQRQFNTMLQLQQPYSVTGTGAMNALAKLYGLPYSPYQDPSVPTGSANELYTGNISVGGAHNKYMGGYIDPFSGQAYVYKQNTRDIDQGLSDQVTNHLRTGQGSLSGGLSRFGDAILQMQRDGYKYSPQAANGQNGVVTPDGPDMSGFFESPDYNFRRTEGQRGIEQSAAARGGAFSGNALKALNQYNSNLAAGEFGDWYSRLAGIAGIGQASASNQGQAALATGDNISGLLQDQGNARASGIVGAANQWSNALGGFSNWLGKYGMGG